MRSTKAMTEALSPHFSLTPSKAFARILNQNESKRAQRAGSQPGDHCDRQLSSMTCEKACWASLVARARTIGDRDLKDTGMTRSIQLRENRPSLWDYRLGLRGLGLVIYGALPASLGALGAFKAPDQNSLQLSVLGIPFVFFIALAPVVLTFLLTRQRLSAWYLLRDYLYLRSALITLAIIVASIAVCVATRVLNKPDVSAAFAQWLKLEWPNQLNTVWHALLLSFAYLVGSSTLFLTVIKDDSSLPLLPKKDWLAGETELRKRLIETIAAARDWPLVIPSKPIAGRRTELQDHIDEAEKAIDGLRRSATGLGREKLYTELSAELKALKLAVADVSGGSQAAWNKYWSSAAPHNLNKEDRERRQLVRRHSELSILA
jgi:hypothetical protein